MANQYKGAYTIEIDGKEKTLVYDMNALAELEDRFDVDIEDLVGVLEDSVSIRKIRTFLWAGLIHEYMDDNGNWIDEPLTERQVGKWIGTDKTPIKPVIEQMGNALRVAMGVSDEDESDDTPKQAKKAEKKP